MTGAITRGLTLQDFETMTIGQIVDYCITYNKMHRVEEGPEEPEERFATIEEIQNF